MTTTTLGADNFEETVTGNDLVLVDFWAAWCGPCRQFAPVYDRVAQANPDVVFGKVDTEAEQQLAAAAQISSIPTLMAFKKGMLVFAQPGALPQQALEALLGDLRGITDEQLEAARAAQETQTGTTPTEES